MGKVVKVVKNDATKIKISENAKVKLSKNEPVDKDRKKIVVDKNSFALKPGVISRLGVKRITHKPSSFNFKIAKKDSIFSTTHHLKTGKVELSFGRKSDLEKLAESNAISSKRENQGNWTCNIKDVKITDLNYNGFLLNPQFYKIFVGGVYDMKNIASGQYNTVPFSRKPITISSEGTNLTKTTVSSPSSSNIEEAVHKLRASGVHAGGITHGAKFKMNSEQELFIRTSGSGNYLGFGGNHDFTYKTNEKSNKYVVELYQIYYTVHVDSSVNEPGDYFYLKSESDNTQAIEDKDVDPNWVYVDSVSYGRILYIVYESDYSFEEHDIDVNMYAYFGFANGELGLNERQKEILKETRVTIACAGGKPEKVAPLLNANSFKAFQQRIDSLLSDKNDEVKIGYTLATLDQATVGARVITNYTSRECSPRATRYRVIWENIRNVVNDDPGNASEIKAVARIRAFGDGKSILDIDKKNKPLAEWDELPQSVKKIAPAPWTFTEGSKNNPLELAQSELWKVNKSIDFNVPINDPEAKIAIRVDLTEYDSTSADDNFEENLWSAKISELSDKEEVSLMCRHEASRIEFKFKIQAIY